MPATSLACGSVQKATGTRSASGADAEDELGRRPPGVACRIDVVLAPHVAEDDPLRLGRAAAFAESGCRPAAADHCTRVDVHLRARRQRVLRAQGHDLQRVLALRQAVLVAQHLLSRAAGHQKSMPQSCLTPSR